VGVGGYWSSTDMIDYHESALQIVRQS